MHDPLDAVSTATIANHRAIRNSDALEAIERLVVRRFHVVRGRCYGTPDQARRCPDLKLSSVKLQVPDTGFMLRMWMLQRLV